MKDAWISCKGNIYVHQNMYKISVCGPYYVPSGIGELMQAINQTKIKLDQQSQMISLKIH